MQIKCKIETITCREMFRKNRENFKYLKLIYFTIVYLYATYYYYYYYYYYYLKKVHYEQKTLCI